MQEDTVIKKELINASKKLKRLGLLPAFSGNLSYRYNDVIYITPSMVDKEELRINDIAKIDMKGRSLNEIKPSSEYRLHIEIYKKRKDIKSVIHTHPAYTIAFSVSKLKPNFNLAVEFEVLVKNISFSKFKQPGSIELAKEVANKVKDSDVVVLENHGLVVVSDSIKNGIAITEEVENFFKINFFVSILNRITK